MLFEFSVGTGRDRHDHLPFSEWTQVIPNARLCKALIDRITDRAHIIETGAESYRFRRTLETQRPSFDGQLDLRCAAGGEKRAKCRTMVERASNADRARYVLRTSPSAHQRKDQTIKIFRKKDQTQRVGQI